MNVRCPHCHTWMYLSTSDDTCPSCHKSLGVYSDNPPPQLAFLCIGGPAEGIFEDNPSRRPTMSLVMQGKTAHYRQGLMEYWQVAPERTHQFAVWMHSSLTPGTCRMTTRQVYEKMEARVPLAHHKPWLR